MSKRNCPKVLISTLKQLKDQLKGNKIIILGIGNILRRDDGFGSHLVRQLKGNIKAKVINGESVPENYLGSIAKEKPDLILIVDAVDFSDKPGTIRLFAPNQIKTTHLFATHNLSCQLLINFLQSQTKVDILFLAVQPKDISLGEGLSEELKESSERLKDALIKILGR
jgi:hydrogenase 3 maturation protease